MKQNYIGFPDTDKFLGAIDRERPVNVIVGRKHGKPGKYGIAVDSTVLTLSQVQGNEVLYFEHYAHRYQTMNGQVMDLRDDRTARIAERVEELVKRYLEENGVKWREALLAMPASYVTLNGMSTFMTWSKEEDNYLYTSTKKESA